MHQLEFTRTHEYAGSDGVIVIPVMIRAGSSEIPLAATLDTGASFCLFAAEIAEALGLSLTAGFEGDSGQQIADSTLTATKSNFRP